MREFKERYGMIGVKRVEQPGFLKNEENVYISVV